MERALFVTGIARSGTTLLCRMLGRHSRIHLAADPLLPLFGMARSAVINEASKCGKDVEAPAGCFPDYYFTQSRINAFEEVQQASLDIAVDRSWVGRLQRVLRDRAALEHPELAAPLAKIGGASVAELLQNALLAVAQSHDAKPTHWVGVKEVWMLELFPAILRSIPQAKCIVISRDPRATVNSMVGLRAKHPDQAGHTLSYARHWRKYAALLDVYRQLPEVREQIVDVRYEDLVDDPESVVMRLCEFLELQHEPQVVEIDTSIRLAVDPSSQEVTPRNWNGNSSFHDRMQGISPATRDAWIDRLPSFDRQLTELVCGVDQAMLGYEHVPPPDVNRVGELIEGLRHANQQPNNWRSDLNDPELDLMLEIERCCLLMSDKGPDDIDQIKRSFLAPGVMQTIRRDCRLRRAA